MGVLIKIMALASIFNFFMPVSMAVNSNCDYYQELEMGQQYYIYNQEYPSNYGPSTACRWIAQSPPNTKIILSCEVNLPSSSNCNGDRLSIALNGDSNLNNPNNYCGQGQLSLVSDSNALAVGLFATSTSQGGKFLCTLTAIQNGPPTTTTAQPITCDCGWRKPTRIVGGVDTGVNEFPSMAGLIDVNRRDLYCGASIISDRYAVTAAHCLTNRVPSNIGLLVGDHNIATGTETSAAALYALAEFRINENYNSSTMRDDIAVVRTQQVMTFSMEVGPICLPFRFSSDSFTGQEITALGWGQTEFSGPKSDILQKVNLTIISNQVCQRDVINPFSPITQNQICTFAPNKDTCQSDSGGPLLWDDLTSRRLQLVGIVSYGYACAIDSPAVNTRVTSYLSWIISVTSDAVYCIK